MKGKTMKASNVISKSWDEYVRLAIPPNASRTQIRETKRAFYAGAAACFGGIMSVDGMSEGAEPTDEDVALLDGIHAELKRYNEQVQKGFG